MMSVEDSPIKRPLSRDIFPHSRRKAIFFSLQMAPDVIIPYDEFILQLDHSLTQTFQTPEASVLMHAAKNVDCSGGKYFFHNNYSAIARLDVALRLCEEHLLLLKEREPHLYDINLKAHQARKLLLRDPEKLLNAQNIGVSIKPTDGIDGALKATKMFVYPGRLIKNPDGSVTHFSS